MLRIIKLEGCQRDTLAEWLRRRPAKPVGSARVGSNPTGVVLLFYYALKVTLTLLNKNPLDVSANVA